MQAAQSVSVQDPSLLLWKGLNKAEPPCSASFILTREAYTHRMLSKHAGVILVVRRDTSRGIGWYRLKREERGPNPCESAAQVEQPRVANLLLADEPSSMTNRYYVQYPEDELGDIEYPSVCVFFCSSADL